MNHILTWVNPPTGNPRSTLLLRMMVGGVLMWEGILKFVYTNQGVDPSPNATADFVGCLEIMGGLLLLSGLMTRLIAIPFIIENDRCHTLDESLAVSGNSTLAFAAGTAAGWDLEGKRHSPPGFLEGAVHRLVSSLPDGQSRSRGRGEASQLRGSR